MKRMHLPIALGLLLLCGAAGAQTLDKIRKSGEIVLGYRTDGVPFSFERQPGRAEGFVVDLCQRVVTGIAQQLGLAGLRTTWVPVTAASRIGDVASGKIDLECGTTTVTLDRQKQVDFSLITFVDGGAFLARRGAVPGSNAELGKTSVAVSRGTTTEAALRRMVKENKLDTTIETVTDHVEGMNRLLRGQVAAYAADRTVLVGLAVNVNQREVPLQLSDMMFSYEPFALMLRRDADFRLAVNRVLARVYREGEIFELFGRWFGPLGEPSAVLKAVYIIQSLPE